MSDNEVKEMFGYLSKDQEASLEKVKLIFQAVYREGKPLSGLPPALSRADFDADFQKATQPERVDEELLYLFYQLDR